MVKDVEDYVRSCDNCQRNKCPKRKPLGLLYPHDRPGGRWATIALDFIVQLPTTKEGKYDAIYINSGRRLLEADTYTLYRATEQLTPQKRLNYYETT